MQFPKTPENTTVSEERPNPSTLPNKHQNTLDLIFEPGQESKVGYNDFETLWKALGCQIKTGKGGSHRTLKNAQGKTVGGTFEPHNGRSYGPRCIHQLRDALKAVSAHI